MYDDGGFAVNVAVTDSSELIVTAHVPVPEQPPPDQPAKLDPAAAAAVNVTCVPAVKLCEQLPGQLIPEPVTLPDPVPANPTDSVCDDAGFAVNVAVTDSSELIVTAHAPVPEQPPPDQPAKLDPAAAAAVNVTCVPAVKLCEQLPGQLIPEPVTLPDPVPANPTDSVCDDAGFAVNVAVTDS